MITNFKIFEENEVPYFSVGDKVICIDGEANGEVPIIYNIYLIVSIYDEYGPNDRYRKYYNYITENDINSWYVDVKDIKTGVILKEWLAERFKPELIYNTDKFNL